ncbi:uncharacterized protein RCC_01689 [Ramularia collo-cygni]|uniref:Uncharacterized protein n=1 Tax=Ramularia collo-cygni TaxID=112498 RepID=A0A2D3V6B7_9PEZI|nr:uncharacterized protein RCC_01689 [Ramularia collo-cygni]CZT15853.1 uncharacterized protein RCC_01689 [Ramularia collo-cygni]
MENRSLIPFTLGGGAAQSTTHGNGRRKIRGASWNYQRLMHVNAKL